MVQNTILWKMCQSYKALSSVAIFDLISLHLEIVLTIKRTFYSREKQKNHSGQITRIGKLWDLGYFYQLKIHELTALKSTIEEQV